MVVTSQSLVKKNFDEGLKLGDSVSFIASVDFYFFTERIVNYRCDILLLFRPPSGIAGLSWFELPVDRRPSIANQAIAFAILGSATWIIWLGHR
jgi:hypothetical protein